MFVGTFCHKDLEDMDRTGEDEEQDATINEPVEQEGNAEDEKAPEIMSMEIIGLGNMSMNALQFANTMAIVNMMKKQERDMLANQEGEETHVKE